MLGINLEHPEQVATHFSRRGIFPQTLCACRPADCMTEDGKDRRPPPLCIAEAVENGHDLRPRKTPVAFIQEGSTNMNGT